MKVLNELRQFYPLDELLKAAEIPRSTFYYHLKALSKPDKYADVKKRIGEIYHENKGRYCGRKIKCHPNYRTLQRSNSCKNPFKTMTYFNSAICKRFVGMEAGIIKVSS